ncbi:MAG TPA: MFS transporter [Nitrososphaerales archaeon]|nr:MFS transporter [Nitrososphaerales archaeon]
MQYKWTVLTVTTVGVLMSGLDGRIVLIGLPTVAAALHADAEQAIWFTQAYTLGSTVALLFIGRVSDVFGRVKVYSIGFSVFTVGSLLTSLSGNPDAFIASRIFQGLGASALFANSAAIITDAFPRGQLGTALGINQIAFRVGSVTGLTVSGLILTFLNWRYLFYINIPIGIFGTLWAAARLHELNKHDNPPPMDWVGVTSFLVFITTLLLALTFAAYGLGDLLLVAILLAASAGTLVIFVRNEVRSANPALDLNLLRIREFTGGIVAQLLNALAWGAFLLVISLYLQLVKGLTPLQAGFAILPFDVAFLLVGPLSGRFSDKYGTIPFTTAGLALISLSLFIFSRTSVSTPYSLVAADLVLGGAGSGLFTSPNISSIMSSVPSAERGVASAVRAIFFNVGYVLSFNIIILIMAQTIPYSEITGIISALNPSTIPEVERAAFSASLSRVYVVLTVVNAAAIIPSALRGRSVREPEPSSNSAEAMQDVD